MTTYDLRLISYCNSHEYPLRDFIDRTLGPGNYYRPPTTDLAMRWPPYTEEELRDLNEFYAPRNPAPQFYDVSDVHHPADRIAMMSYETPGAAVGHREAIIHADFS